MNIRILGLLSISILLISCSVEKVNLSPVSNIISNNTFENTAKSLEENSNLIKYSSEITNSFSHIYSFSKKEVNEEIRNLKFITSEYIYAIKEHNTIGKEKAIFNYEKSYKKLQKMKNRLPNDEQLILNRFLVNIKTNISLIESLEE